MNQVNTKETTDTVTAVTKRFFTVRKFAIKNKEKGTWPNSESAIWALRAGAPGNGFGKAFITIGRRVLIDEGKLWAAIEGLQEESNVSGK